MEKEALNINSKGADRTCLVAFKIATGVWPLQARTYLIKIN